MSAINKTMMITKKKRPNARSNGLTTHHHDRLASPQEAPAKPATFKTNSTAKANPKTGNDTVAVALLLLLLVNVFFFRSILLLYSVYIIGCNKKKEILLLSG